MDTHVADDKLKELHVEDIVVKANDRSTENYEIDPVAEKKLLRKIDLHLIPVLWFLYMLAFLDRTNIGAQLQFSHRSRCPNSLILTRYAW